jgi:hypothetical protein
MKTYSVLFAEDIPYYGTVEIEAENDVAALEVAKAYDLSEVTTDPEWGYSVCKRIVYIEDPNGKTIHYDVPLDDCILRRGGKKERRSCDAAPQLLKALEMCEQAIKEATGIMRYDDSQPVTALEGYEIERAYTVLTSVLGEAHQAITAAQGEQS